MTAPLNLHLCQEDSPIFRKELANCESSVFGLENTIKNLVKLSRSSVELAQEYTVKQLQFAEELGIFAKQQPESIIKTVLTKYVSSLQEVERSRRILSSHIFNMFIEPLEAFAKNEILPLKDIKKSFEKAGNEVDAALSKYMNKRPKDSMIREILALMFTESSFYHQSYEILKDLEPHMKDVTRLLHEARVMYDNDIKESQILKKKIFESAQETYDPLRSAKISKKYNTDSGSSGIKKSGYLYMKGNQRVMQTWARKYFTISGELLSYCSKSGKISKEEDDSASINLRVCHVKVINNSDRRFCFEILSPMRTYVLQAENQADMEDWIYCLQTAAKEALYSEQLPRMISGDTRDSSVDNTLLSFQQENGNGEDASKSQAANDRSQNSKHSIHQIKQVAGNGLCADCKLEDPQWASTNFGTLLCIECSGIHRSLGVHVSKVRSLMLDKWEPETVEVMLRLGNSNANQIFEAKLLEKKDLLNKSSWKRAEREKFITDKYVNKEYIIRKDEDKDIDMNVAFWEEMNNSNLQGALKYLSLGAYVDWKNDQRNGTTALHQAIRRSDDVAVEFLLLWSSDINAVDEDGWSGLHHAAATNNARLLLNLMKRHADINLKDKRGKRPVDVALELQKVEAVTALRLFQFENQLTRSEYSTFGVDEALTSISKPYNRTASSSIDLRINTNKTSTRSAPATPPPSSRGLLEDDDLNSPARSSMDSFTSQDGISSKFPTNGLKLQTFGQWENIEHEDGM
ncbi:5506_t:CDS:10 [Acaulospora colombiana]|uniref:5506_t:CDS:1 n=1 Tax=Acaulospora colombiana TaxID=27376 RepID=A0ACA9JV85_9GLOM|nr:5506_t:CDS:10 [Acaulospora colombiana]